MTVPWLLAASPILLVVLLITVAHWPAARAGLAGLAAALVVGLLTSASNGDLSIGDLSRLLQIGIEHGRRDAQEPGPQLGMEDAWRIMDELGFSEVVQAVFGAIAGVLSYGGPRPEERGQEEGGNPP